MTMVKLTINGREVEAPAGTTILEAARKMGIYIPVLCHHPDLVPAKGSRGAAAIYQGETRIENSRPGEGAEGCGMCLVEILGQSDFAAACSTEVRPGLVVVTDNPRIKAERQENLVPILARHPHACLTCAVQEGCSRTQCSSNVALNERCCTLFGRCELQAVSKYVGIPPQTPRWVSTGLPVLDKDPLFTRDYNLCIGCTRCVRACRELRGVEAIGFVYDDEGRIQVGSLAPVLGESGCRFCTACVEVCPTGALMDKSLRSGKKVEDLVPCKEDCPAHIDIPAYLRLIAEGRNDEANAVIREKVAFPGVLGRVCTHPCEQVCRRGEVNQPISICSLKRYAADGDQGLWKKRGKCVSPSTGQKVAVIGAGPAGLTAAFHLRKAGHAVTLFESGAKAGGMLRYAVPRYRLPEEVLDKEIRDILDTGIDFKPFHTLGKEFTLEQLREEGFEAVFLAVGAQLSRRISLKGSDLPDVLWGLCFLRQVAEGNPVKLKNRVIVVGGGSVAVDVALTAMRCGAKEVEMVCLEKREEMVAHTREVETALAEGVRLMTSWGPQRILSRDGRVAGMELAHCESVFDDQGVFNPRFDNTRKTIGCDQVILSIGQTTDLSFLHQHGDILTDKGFIVVDQKTMETGKKGVYAGGDAAMPGSIIHAVGAGRRGASFIDKSLGGSGDVEETLFERGAPDPLLGRREGFSSLQREKVPELDLQLRHTGFREVALGYSKEQAEREAGRCLQCDLRLFMGRNPFPPEERIPFSEKTVEQVPETEGVFRLYDEDQNLISIKGTADMRRDLLQILEHNEKAKWFDFEEDKMYSRKESELLRNYIQSHGRMPGAGDDDDLF